jgi:hypothetical protein
MSGDPSVIGIDPGKSGGLAVVDVHSGIVQTAVELPLSGRRVDALEFVRIAREAAPVVAVAVEEQSGRPSDGVRSLNYLLPQFGGLVAVCEVMLLPCLTPKPPEWKRCVLRGTARDKQAAIEYVRRLHPYVNLHPRPRMRNAHDGIADAVCIGTWARNVALEQHMCLGF